VKTPQSLGVPATVALHLGKPDGAVKPASLKAGLPTSIPVSRIAILMPLPALLWPPIADCAHAAGAFTRVVALFSEG